MAARTGIGSNAMRWAAGVLLVALLGSVLLYHRMWAEPTARTVGYPGRFTDQVQSMWFLKWVPWRLAHGHNPFPTTAMDYPSGVDLAWNTSTPSLAILFAPVTAIAGAAFTYNLLLTLAPALASATGFLWLRRHVTRPATAAVGGLLIGFQPYMAAHLHGHLHLAFIALLPLVLIFAEDLLWRRPRPQWRTGLYLGVTVAVQLGISEETLVVTALGMCIAALAYLAVDARALGRSLRAAAAPLGLAVVVALVLSAPLLVEQFIVAGSVHMNNNVWRARGVDYLSPSNQLLSIPSGHHFVGAGEQSVYIGWTLLTVLVVGVIVARRSRLTLVAAVTIAALVVLTFGDVHRLGVPLPWHFIGAISGFAALLPLRIALASWFVIAWLLAQWVDALMPQLRAPRRASAAAAHVGLGAIAAALLTLVPSTMNAAPLPHTPPFFTAAHPDLPRGAPIVVLPSATPRDASAMYWQQRSGFRFAMPGGYAYNDLGSLWPVQTPLIRVAEQHTTAPVDVALARAELTRDRYRAVVVVMGRAETPAMLHVGQLLTGRGPDRVEGGVSLWLLR